MLAHQRFYPSAFSPLDGFNNTVMLTMRVQQQVVHAIQARFVESQCLRTDKRNVSVALQGLFDHRTACLADDQIVKPGVHVSVERFVALLHVAFLENPVTVRQAYMQRLAKGSGNASLGQAACCQPLHDTAQIDCIENVSNAYGFDNIAARPVFDEQTFLGENRQCLAYGRPRHPQPFGKWRLGNALTR